MSFLKSSLPVIFCFLCLPSATRSFSNKFQGNPSARRGSQPKRRITFSTRLSSVAAGGISSSGGGSGTDGYGYGDDYGYYDDYYDDYGYYGSTDTDDGDDGDGDGDGDGE